MAFANDYVPNLTCMNIWEYALVFESLYDTLAWCDLFHMALMVCRRKVSLGNDELLQQWRRQVLQHFFALYSDPLRRT